MKYKLLTTSIIITALTLSTNTFASANVAKSLCESVVADDKGRVRSLLRQHKYKIRTIFDDVKCNNKNLLEFADLNNSVNMGVYIISKLPRKIVKREIPKLKNSEILKKAQDRIKN